jgi:hypothetical protein
MESIFMTISILWWNKTDRERENTDRKSERERDGELLVWDFLRSLSVGGDIRAWALFVSFDNWVF